MLSYSLMPRGARPVGLALSLAPLRREFEPQAGANLAYIVGVIWPRRISRN